MTSDEFAKIFYIEKLNFLKSCFEEQLKEVIDTLLTDIFYSFLLGLDGEKFHRKHPADLQNIR